MGLNNSFANVIISCNEKKQVDLDALNLIASGKITGLCSCAYRFEKKHHRFVYAIEGMQSLSALQHSKFSFEKTICVLSSFADLIESIFSKGLVSSNLKIAKDYIFQSGSEFKFIYVPLEQTTRLSLKDSLLKLLSAIRCKDIRVINFLKDIKKLSNDDQVKARLNTFVMSNSDYIENYPEISEFEAETSLLNEGETTLLQSGNSIQSNAVSHDSIPPKDNEETTVFGHGECDEEVADMMYGPLQATAFIEDASSENETTVLTHNPYIEPEFPVDKGLNKIHLYLVNSRSGEKISVDITPFTMGKDAANVDYVINNESVSRHHATIIFDEGVYYILDNNSTNGTIIEGIRLQPNEKAEIENGYMISLGSESFQSVIERR